MTAVDHEHEADKAEYRRHTQEPTQDMLSQMENQFRQVFRPGDNRPLNNQPTQPVPAGERK